MSDKPGIVIEIEKDGNIHIGTNIEDKILLRQTLKIAEELIIADALRKASVQQQVIPVRTMPTLVTKSN